MPAVTVLQLDTSFPRIPGDVACPQTYLGEVEVIRIAQASVAQVVSDRPDLIDIAPFEDAVRRAKGDVIVTSCGFLSYWQDQLAALADRPFVASALIGLKRLDNPTVLTFDAASLTPLHLRGAACRVVGLSDDLHLKQVIRGDLPHLDITQVAAEMTTLELPADTKHLLLECTNLPPYKHVFRKLFDVPITDILTEIERLKAGTIDPAFL